MRHGASSEDVAFRCAFEACEMSPTLFDHRAHLRLAYVYLCGDALEGAFEKMQASLLRFLGHLGAGETKYHATMTRAWIMAVNHFMAETAPCSSASSFLAANPALLNSCIMLRHYSAGSLFSSDARQSFVQPDLRPLP
jgi:hypothetical protein